MAGPGGRTEYRLDRGDGTYSVSYTDVPEATARADPGTLLDAAAEAALAGIRGARAQRKQVAVEGSPGREIRCELPGDRGGGLYRSRLYLVGRRLFTLAVSGPGDVVDSPDTETFLNSFRPIGD